MWLHTQQFFPTIQYFSWCLYWHFCLAQITLQLDITCKSIVKYKKHYKQCILFVVFLVPFFFFGGGGSFFFLTVLGVWFFSGISSNRRLYKTWKIPQNSMLQNKTMVLLTFKTCSYWTTMFCIVNPPQVFDLRESRHVLIRCLLKVNWMFMLFHDFPRYALPWLSMRVPLVLKCENVPRL